MHCATACTAPLHARAGDSYTLYSSYQNGWTDAGKFLTGFTAVAAIAIPSVLAHAQVRLRLPVLQVRLRLPVLQGWGATRVHSTLKSSSNSIC